MSKQLGSRLSCWFWRLFRFSLTHSRSWFSFKIYRAENCSKDVVPIPLMIQCVHNAICVCACGSNERDGALTCTFILFMQNIFITQWNVRCLKRHNTLAVIKYNFFKTAYKHCYQNVSMLWHYFGSLDSLMLHTRMFIMLYYWQALLFHYSPFNHY